MIRIDLSLGFFPGLHLRSEDMGEVETRDVSSISRTSVIVLLQDFEYRLCLEMSIGFLKKNYVDKYCNLFRYVERLF